MPIILASRRRAALGGAGIILALAACRAPSPIPPAPSAPAAQASAPPRAAAGLAVDAATSLIAITVRRGGVLARLGHDHVVAVRTLAGNVDPELGRATLRFRLDQLTVDEPALRSEAGLDTQPSADAVAGTRHNMLTRVLDAEHYPWVIVAIERQGEGAMRAAVTLHGVTRQYTVPVVLTRGPNGLAATGTLTLRQTDFGLVPFAVLGGALAVQDELAVRFAIVAH